MKKVLFITLLSIIATIRLAQAQTDYTFWFVAPDILNTQDNPIALIVSTYNDAANVTISIPANPSFTPLNYSIPANSTQSIALTTWKSMIENIAGDSIQNKGIEVVSDHPVTAYYELQYVVNKEMFTLKGSNALGTKFYVPFQTFGNNGMGNSWSAFDIVATMNNTNITIVPTKDVYFSSTVVHPANVPFTRILNTGQTYSVRANSAYGIDRLAGSSVTSNHPIAITMKDDCLYAPSYGSCNDLIGDQILPIEKTGYTYIVPDGQLFSPGDRAIITAGYDSTRVYLDGNSIADTLLNKGEYYTISIPVTPSTNSSMIHSANPITVLHVSGNGCEYGAAMIPPIDAGYFVSNSVAFARSCPTNEIFSVMLITHNGNQNSFTVNGNSGVILSTSFSAVPGSSGNWVEAKINLSSTISSGQACRISNSSGNFHCGVLCGGTGSGCSYGYFTDFYNNTGITEISEEQNISISPNPTQGIVNFFCINQNNNQNDLLVSVFDIRGSHIESKKLTFSGFNATLDLSNYNKGIYIVVVTDQNKYLLRKKIVLY